MTLSVSKEAEIDLEDIWFYTFEKWSLNQADDYLKSIEEKFHLLISIPEFGTALTENYRYIVHQSHVIFYSILSKEKILIIRVLHSSMDFLQHLKIGQ